MGRRLADLGQLVLPGGLWNVGIVDCAGRVLAGLLGSKSFEVNRPEKMPEGLREPT